MMDNLSGYALDSKLKKEIYEPWAQNLSLEGKKAVRLYTGKTYHEVNDALRSSDKIDPATQAKIDILQNALMKSTLIYPMTLYRGVKAYSGTSGEHLIEMFKNSVGQTFTDKAFISTAYDKDSAFGGTIELKIHTPAGLHGAYVDPLSINDGENEVLLPHSTKFTVKSFKEDPNWAGYYLVELDALPN